MMAVVGGLGTALLQRKELVAQIDEGRSLTLAAKFEFEQATVEGQSLFDVTDLEGDMIETDGTRFLCSPILLGDFRPERRFCITPLPLAAGGGCPRAGQPTPVAASTARSSSGRSLPRVFLLA
jgi:hypothetical protein